MALAQAEEHRPALHREAPAVRDHNRNAAKVDTSPHQPRAGQRLLVQPLALAHSLYVGAILGRPGAQPAALKWVLVGN